MRRTQLKSGFRIRCSQISKIMVKKPSDTLNVGGMTYIDKEVIQDYFGRDIEIDSKYIDKGVKMEKAAIDFLGEHYFNRKLSKNSIRFENDFLSGEPDVLLPKSELAGIEIKNSFDIDTFPFFETELSNIDYWYQCQGYMDLTGADSWYLCYVLMDHTDDWLSRQERLTAKQFDSDDITPDIAELVIKRWTYGDIEPDNRIKVFRIDRDTTAIEAIHKRCKIAMDYYKTRMSILSGK